MTPTRSTSATDARQTSLDAFMLDLGELPLLPPERINELATEVREQEAAFRAAMEAIPASSALVVERWELIRSERRVTGLLSQYYRDDPSQDWTAFIDERVGHVAELIGAERTSAEQLGEALASASIRFEVLHEFAVYLRELADAPGSRGKTRRCKELGLSGRRWRTQLGRVEAALAARDAARQEIAAHNLRLVVHVAKRYRGNGVAFADLIQEGGLGLMRAVDKFDPSLGYRFSTYAVWWIEQSMIRAIQKLSRTVRVPSHVYEQQLRVRRAEEKLRGRVDRDVAAADIAEQIGSDEASVERLLIHMAPARSLDAPHDEDDERRLVDGLEDPDGERWQAKPDLDRARSVIDGVLGHLPQREREVLIWRFGLDGKEELTLQEIGTRLSLSRERVRQIANGAIEKLRNRDAVKGLKILIDESTSE